jgi:glycosyltransferase involved in cell wall biosynthesis
VDKIFISIASYRDPELLPTIRDCIARAKDPKRLVFGICWQRDEKETLAEFAKDKRFRVLDVPYKDSKGACWARYSIQQLYKGEKYHLQLDSHHRFVDNWDEICISTVKRLQKKGHKKPLLTAYIPSYDPSNDPAGRAKEPWKMNFDRFTPEGVVFFLPASIDNWRELDGYPVPSRFLSAHFIFTLGSWIKDVPYDPEYYFHGEEISLAVRSFTHGYDLFHPTQLIAWHEYTRRGRVKQWDDDKDWGKRNTHCHIRNRKLFEMDGEKRDIDFGPYGFGKKRTLEDYERYAGISFKYRGIQQYTRDNNLAPNPPVPDFDSSIQCIFRHCIDVGYSQVPEKDYDFWCVVFKDAQGNDIFRKDAVPDEIERMMKDPDGYCKVWREFHYKGKPHKWIVWPHSKSKGWCQIIEGTL